MPVSTLDATFARFTIQRSKKIRVKFYRQLDRLLKNGVPVNRALKMLWERASDDGRKPGKPAAVAIATWMTAARGGTPLARALEGWIPAREQMIIEAGETAGDLALTDAERRERGEGSKGALLDAAEIALNAARVRAAIVGGLAYPTTIVIAVIGVLWLFGVQVIPPFGEILDPARWTGAAASLRGLSGWVQVWTFPSIGILLASFVLYALLAPRWRGRLRRHADRLPPFSMYRLAVGASFLMSLAALLRAGVSVPDALRKIRRGATPYLAERLDAALFHVKDGRNIGVAFKLAGHRFPDTDIIQELEVYATLTGFEDALTSIAKDWLEEAVTRVQTQSKAMNQILLFVVAGVIAWITWGLYALQQQVTSAAQI